MTGIIGTVCIVRIGTPRPARGIQIPAAIIGMTITTIGTTTTKTRIAITRTVTAISQTARITIPVIGATPIMTGRPVQAVTGNSVEIFESKHRLKAVF